MLQKIYSVWKVLQNFCDYAYVNLCCQGLEKLEEFQIDSHSQKLQAAVKVQIAHLLDTQWKMASEPEMSNMEGEMGNGDHRTESNGHGNEQNELWAEEILQALRRIHTENKVKKLLQKSKAT